MRTFAPIAMLVALLTSLLLGGGAAAQASSAGSWECVNKSSIKLVSCTLNDITVNVKNVKVLSDNEISILEDSLNKNHVDVDILSGDITVAKNKIVEIYKNDLNITINVGDVNVCILAVCK